MNTNFLAKIGDTIRAILPKAAEPNPGDAVTIATLPPMMEAQAEVMRGRLEADGIPCFILRERTYYVDPIQLRVRRADADQATAILKELEDA